MRTINERQSAPTGAQNTTSEEQADRPLGDAACSLGFIDSETPLPESQQPDPQSWGVLKESLGIPDPTQSPDPIHTDVNRFAELGLSDVVQTSRIGPPRLEDLKPGYVVVSVRKCPVSWEVGSVVGDRYVVVQAKLASGSSIISERQSERTP